MLPRSFYIANALLGVLSILLMIFSGIIIIKTQPNNKISAGVVDYITLNLATPPIQDLQVVTNSKCPAGFVLLELGRWPGTVAGCIEKGKPERYCNKIEIDSIPPRELYQWKQFQFCIKRNSDYDFGNIDTCKAGYKQCNSQLCVSVAEECPLTSVTMEDSNPVAPDTT